MNLAPLTLILLLVISVSVGAVIGYGASGPTNEGFGTKRYKCKEYIDMSKYMLKTECPPMPNLNDYVLKKDVPKCPPCICSCKKPCNIGKCPPCPRPRCPPPRKCHCKPCAPCPQPVPMRCPEPEIVIKEVHKKSDSWGGPRPALSPLYGIYGNYK